MQTLVLALEHSGIERPTNEGFYLVVRSRNQATLNAQLSALADNMPTAAELVASLDAQALQRNKYDVYVPEMLLRTAFATDALDMAGTLEALRTSFASQ